MQCMVTFGEYYFTSKVNALKAPDPKSSENYFSNIKGTCSKIFGRLIFVKLADMVTFMSSRQSEKVEKFVSRLQEIRENNAYDKK